MIRVLPVLHRNAYRGFSISAFGRMQHKGSYRSSDATVETDEIVSDNNPWSPTLYDDKVYIREPKALRSKALPSNFRLSYQALYEAPGAKYVALLKRLTLSFAVIGGYGAKLLFDSVQLDDIYGVATLVGCGLPAVYVQYKTKDYVTRIFRLYDKDKPQTLENLVNDEQLIIEKLSFTGGKTYNQLLKISDNKGLKLLNPKTLPFFTPYSTWEETSPSGTVLNKHFIVDDVGGMKMDRIWGIVERNSDVDNGRYMETTKNTN